MLRCMHRPRTPPHRRTRERALGGVQARPRQPAAAVSVRPRLQHPAAREWKAGEQAGAGKWPGGEARNLCAQTARVRAGRTQICAPAGGRVEAHTQLPQHRRPKSLWAAERQPLQQVPVCTRVAAPAEAGHDRRLGQEAGGHAVGKESRQAHHPPSNARAPQLLPCGVAAPARHEARCVGGCHAFRRRHPRRRRAQHGCRGQQGRAKGVAAALGSCSTRQLQTACCMAQSTTQAAPPPAHLHPSGRRPPGTAACAGQRGGRGAARPCSRAARAAGRGKRAA
jgi:hypothetical protein